MNSHLTCPECGAELPANAPQGLCPRCLARMGMDLQETVPLPKSDFQVERTGTMIGRYKLLEKIGEGGFGVVFMAEQVEPVQRKVALKIIKAGMDTKEVIARFEAERQAIALMDHPNIARVLDAGATAAGRPYFVMELVRGIPITEYCDRENLPTRERLQLFIKVCQAVQHAHQKGVIHRDIKPSNVLVTQHDGEPVPKVIDFGVAKALGQRLTEKTLFTGFQHMIGTPAYMSPEQAALSGLDIDTRADIYSLGVLLYELLTGVTPFDADTFRKAAMDEIRRMIRETEPPKPSTRLQTLGEKLTGVAKRRGTEPAALGRLVRGDLDWIVMKCLEKDRQRRYETANGLAVDVERHLHSEPVVARPPSNLYRFQKLLRRHKLVFASATALVAVLLLGVTVSTWQAVRATRAEQRAKTAEGNAIEKAGLAEREQLRAEAEKTAAQRNAYSAKMLLAEADWDGGNLAHLRTLLAETSSHPDRGFEWYYWQRMLHLDVMTLHGRFKSVFAVTFSPDGSRIASASDDRMARVWAADTGRELLTLTGHRGYVLSLTFSPDGRRIVTGSEDGTVKVWDSDTGRELLTLRGHTNSVSSVAFSPDGEQIVSGGGDRTVRVWESDSGRELLTLQAHAEGVTSVAFSPDGRRIISGSDDCALKVWEVASGREQLSWQGHAGGVHSVAFSPDGQRIVSGGGDRAVKVWEAGGGHGLLTLTGHRDEVRSVGFSPDGGSIVSGSGDESIKLWDAKTGREQLTLRGHVFEGLAYWAGAWRSEPRGPAVAFSPDGRWIVSGSDDGTVKVWDANSGHDQKARRDITDSVASEAFSPDGRRIVRSLTMLEANHRGGSLTLRGHGDWVRSVAFSPDSRKIVSGSDDGTARVWESDTGHELLTLRGHTDLVLSVAFSPDGRHIATGSSDLSVKVWEADGGGELLNLRAQTEVSSVMFSPDGRWIVSGGGDATCRLWDARSGRLVRILEPRDPTKASEPIGALAFSPDGIQVVSGGLYGTLRVWEAASGRELLSFEGHEDIIDSVAFSPDGRQILSASADLTVRLSEAQSGRAILTLRGQATRPRSAAFSPDGRRIVGGSADRSIKLWEADGGCQLLTLPGHTAAVLAARFSPDGRRIASGSKDHTVRVWTSASSEQVSRWHQEERDAEERLRKEPPAQR